MKAAESFFQLKSYIIEELKIKVMEISDSRKIRFNVSLNPQFSDPIERDDEILSEVVLELTIKGYSKRRIVRNIYVRIKGLFIATPPVEKEKFSRLCQINGVMNLLMLARSYIATTTAQMGIEPIIIPMVDLTKTPVFKSMR